jgi:hypothetical protein
MKRRTALTLLCAAALAQAVLAAPALADFGAMRTAVAARIGNPDRISAGARAWLLGPQSTVQSPLIPRELAGALPALPSFGTNVDANDPAHDFAAGQEETAIGATAGGLVMAAWNDASAFLNPDSTTRLGSGTGVALSNDGARSFVDLIGLPNSNPDQVWAGDPAVVALDDSHFAVASLYFPSAAACGTPTSVAHLTVAVTVATVSPDGSSATFGPPIPAAPAGNACALPPPPELGGPPPAPPDPTIAFIDKSWMSYDPGSRTLAISYTRFSFAGSGTGQVEVVRAHVPKVPEQLGPRSFGAPIVVWPEEPFCDPGVVPSEAARCGAANTGAYVAVGPGGNAYVAWERNLLTNGFGLPSDPYVYIHAAVVPRRATAPSAGGPSNPVLISAGQPNGSPDGLGTKSTDGFPIPGYNRVPGNDFPRIAVNAPLGEVLVVWNDASLHPLGDIWLRSASLDLARLAPTVQVNDDASSALHALPAVSVRADGTTCVSWYDRRLSGAASTLTDYFGDCRATASDNAPDFRISTGSTDWAATSSVSIPNFGDYTDNASAGDTTYFTWTDGRLGTPQPFVDSRR